MGLLVSVETPESPPVPAPATGATESASAAQTSETQQQAEEAYGDGARKALAAERKSRTDAERELKRLNVELQQIKDKDLSELDKTRKARDEATAELERLKTENLRQTVAIAKQLPAELAGRLKGSTEAELNADADELLSLVTKQKAPKPDASQGSRGEGRSSDMNEVIRTGLRRKRGL